MLLDATKQVTGLVLSYQIENAKRIQTLNIGGSCFTVVSFIVEKY
jgi:acetyl-CoA C-acetyltransferase